MALKGNSNEEKIWNYLKNKKFNDYAIAGLMGNIYAESGFKPNNLQNSYERKLGMTDAEYTAMVDLGQYKDFAQDRAGYGLCQWTSSGRKLNLYNHMNSNKLSIGDLEGQLDFLLKELTNSYKSVYNTLLNAKSIREASDIVLLKFERPADQSESAQQRRAGYGQKYYNKYAKGENQMADYSKYINSTGTHYISNSGSDERKKISGGKAGDQTGHEWELRSWYSRPWTHVFRYTSNSKVGNTLVELGCAAALNSKIGYDQHQRTTYWTQLQKVNYDPSKITTACEEDCSAGVAANVKATGYLLGITALQNVSSSMTSRNTISQLKKAGFTVLTDKKYLTSGKYLLPGDILLYENHHLATNVTKGKYAEQNKPPVVNNDDEKGKGIGTAVALASMYIREDDTTSAKSLGTVSKGAKLELLEILSNGWLKVVWARSPKGYGYTSNRNDKYYKCTLKPISNNNTVAKNKPEAKDEKIAGNYITTGSLNVRNGAGTANSIMTTIPKGTEVYCDGSYTLYNKIKWLYITFKRKSVTFCGFASSKYLKKG